MQRQKFRFLGGLLGVFFSLIGLAKTPAVLHLENLDIAAPNLVFQDPQGKSRVLGDSAGHKVVILHLWASWCEPCKKEIPALLAKFAPFSEQNVEVIFVSIDEDQAKSRQFASSVPSFPTVYSAVKAKSAKPYYAWGVPETYLITKSGKILYRALGLQNWAKVTDSEAQDLVDELKTWH